MAVTDLDDLGARLADIVTADRVLSGEAAGPDYTHDEALESTPTTPAFVVRPGNTAEVSALLRFADEARIPVTARGSGTGLSGACIPRADGIVVSFEGMDAILELDTENHVAVVQPGVTLDQLDEALAPLGLVYPIFPGENSATLGGNVATNAGGMRAVKYGVTRHQVLGLEAVLAGGEVIRTGGKFVKATTGYDLTQLIVGSEGTLALVTEITLRLHPRLEHQATVLAPFATLEEVTRAVPPIVASGVAPLVLEYVDMMAMAATTANVGLDLGIPDAIRDSALAYLFIVLEDHRPDRLDEDTETVSELVLELGAMDAYVLPPHAAAQLLDAREKAFWVAKAHGADEIIDVVVPRASIPAYLATVAELAAEHGALVAGAGHAGDGNVHLSVFQPDPVKRHDVLHGIFAAGLALGGAISAEHGIGTAKKAYLAELEDPAKLALYRRIKAAFDPNGVLNPDTMLA